ncbi:MAG: DUF2950 family protein [Planctomycetes bacterium]|nr:DUF2950 family protein [Planctomycetota bacterium]
MKRQGSALLILIIVVLIAVGFAAVMYTVRSGYSAGTPARNNPDLAIEKYLPNNTLFIISFPDVSLMRERFKNTNLYALWKDEEVQFAVKPFMDMLNKGPVKEKLDEAKNKFQDATGLTIENAINLFHSQAAIAIIDIPSPINPGMPDVVFSINAGQYKDKMIDAIKHIQKKAKEGDADIKEEVSKIKEIEVTSFGDRWSLMHYAFLDTLLVVTSQKERLEKIITCYVEKQANGLSADALFSRVHGKVNGGNEDLFVYCNIKEIIKRYNVLVPEGIRKAMDGLGVYNMDALGGSMEFLPDGMIKENVFIATSGTLKGLPKILSLSPKTDKLSKYIPADAVSYSRVNIDLKETWSELVNICKVLPPISGKVDGFLAELNKKVGFSMADDFLANFGSEMISYGIFPEGGGLLPDGVFIAELKDKGKFEQCARSLANNLNGSLEEITFHGTKINYLRFETVKMPLANRYHGLLDELDEIQGFNKTVIYFIKDNIVFASGSMHPIKRLIMRMEQGFNSIDKNEAFEYLAKNINPASRALMYIDAARFFRPYYDSIFSVGQNFQDIFKKLARGKWPEFVDFNKFPTGETIARYLGQVILACSSDNDGIKIEVRSGIGIEPVSVAGMAIIAAIAIPNLLSSRQVANETTAIASLKTMMAAEVTWRMMDVDGNDIQDYWTKDVSCLYRMCREDDESPSAFISIDLARADGTPYMKGKRGKAGNRKIVEIPQFVPKAGYLFEAMKYDTEGKLYQQDPDEDGYKHSNQYKFAFVAYPAEYGKTGTRVFIINELGIVYAIDPGSDIDKIILRWPGDDPTTITGPGGRYWSVAGN